MGGENAKMDFDEWKQEWILYAVIKLSFIFFKLFVFHLSPN